MKQQELRERLAALSEHYDRVHNKAMNTWDDAEKEASMFGELYGIEQALRAFGYEIRNHNDGTKWFSIILKA